MTAGKSGDGRGQDADWDIAEAIVRLGGSSGSSGSRGKEEAWEIRLYPGFDERERRTLMRAQAVAFLILGVLVVGATAYINYTASLDWWRPEGREELRYLLMMAAMLVPALPIMIAELSTPPPEPES